jgi:hypothetical protein
MLLRKGKVARFRLSPEGEKALNGLFKNPSIQALIEDVDELGAWILLDRKGGEGSGSVMLLKWDYFSTVVVEVEPNTTTVDKLEIGFKP